MSKNIFPSPQRVELHPNQAIEAKPRSQEFMTPILRTPVPKNLNSSLHDAITSLEAKTLNPTKLTKSRDIGYDIVEQMVDKW